MSRKSQPGRKPPAAEAPDDDYEVGYGKPPRAHRFKAGNTFGKGRKKGSKGLKTIVREVLGEKVAVKRGGRTYRITKAELVMYQLVTRAGQGDLKAAEKALALYERYGPEDDQVRHEPEQVRRSLDALRGHLEMHDLLYPREGDRDNDDE